MMEQSMRECGHSINECSADNSVFAVCHVSLKSKVTILLSVASSVGGTDHPSVLDLRR
jgi:hypothetical protein